jgi:hypothetical protein
MAVHVPTHEVITATVGKRYRFMHEVRGTFYVMWIASMPELDEDLPYTPVDRR